MSHKGKRYNREEISQVLEWFDTYTMAVTDEAATIIRQLQGDNDRLDATTRIAALNASIETVKFASSIGVGIEVMSLAISYEHYIRTGEKKE